MVFVSADSGERSVEAVSILGYVRKQRFPRAGIMVWGWFEVKGNLEKNFKNGWLVKAGQSKLRSDR
jgi:hypothetical protein